MAPADGVAVEAPSIAGKAHGAKGLWGAGRERLRGCQRQDQYLLEGRWPGVQCRVQSRPRGGAPTIYMVGVRAKIRGYSHSAVTRG